LSEGIDGLVCFICGRGIDTVNTTIKIHRHRTAHLFCWTKSYSNRLLEDFT